MTVGSRLLARSEPGTLGLAAIVGGELGRIESVYLAIRSRRLSGAAGVDVLAELGPEALGFALAAIPGRLATVYATAGALFGGDALLDTAVLILTAEAGAVTTVELSRCLPATLPTIALGEVEIEVVGTEGAMRIEPFPAVTVATDSGVEARPLLDIPGPARSGTAGPDSLAADDDRVRAALAAARLSLDRGEPIDVLS